MNIKWGVAIGALLVLWSCTISKQQRYYLDKIDSLQTVLDSAEKQYLLLDTMKLARATDVINTHIAHLNSMDTVFSDTVKIYAFIGKSLRSFSGDRQQIMIGLAYSARQLNTLKKDVGKGRLTEEQMNKYYSAEATALSQLLHKMRFNKESIEYQLQSFDYLQDKMEDMLHKNKTDK